MEGKLNGNYLMLIPRQNEFLNQKRVTVCEILWYFSFPCGQNELMGEIMIATY
jgi:hypothetical protein